MRNADLRSRQVELPAGWWKKDLGSFVGFDAETGDPIAVLRVGVAKYVYASPGTQCPSRLQDKTATGSYRVPISSLNRCHIDR